MQAMKQLEHTVDEDTGNIWKHTIHTWHTKGIKNIRFVCERFQNVHSYTMLPKTLHYV